MRLSKKITAIALATVTMSAVCGAVVANTSMFDLTRATGNNSYTCNSIRFGMEYPSTTALTYDCSNTIDSTFFNKVYDTAPNLINESACTYEKVYSGDKNNHNYAIKLGSGSVIGSLSIKLNTTIIGCTVYALGYKTDNVTLSVNGITQTLSHNITPVTKKADAVAETYYPYLFSFNEDTDTINITTGTAPQRLFIADIALRLTGTIPEGGGEGGEGGETTENTITLDYSIFEGQGISGGGADSTVDVEKDGVQVHITNGFGYTSHVRVYKDATLTITYSSNMTKIEITCTSSGDNSNGPGKLSGTNYTYSGTIGTWTGNTNSVTLTASAQCRFTQIVITY